MDMIDDKESDEIDHMGEIKEDDLELEELETDERYQIENTESLKRIDSQKTERMMILLIFILSWIQMW